MERLNLKKLRYGRGITRKSLANRVGVKVRQVSKWEDGVAFPNDAHMIRLLQVLGCRYEELVEEVTFHE